MITAIKHGHYSLGASLQPPPTSNDSICLRIQSSATDALSLKFVIPGLFSQSRDSGIPGLEISK